MNPTGNGFFSFRLQDTGGTEIGRIDRDDTKAWRLTCPHDPEGPLADLALVTMVLADITIGHLLTTNLLP